MTEPLEVKIDVIYSFEGILSTNMFKIMGNEEFSKNICFVMA